MIAVSTNYRKLSPEEVPAIAAELDGAWKDEAIPRRQWISVVRGELERYCNGADMPHFNVFVRAMQRTGLDNPTVLDVGASSGYYSAILKLHAFQCSYVGLDYSQSFKELAEELWPGIAFKVGDARSLPFEDNSFDVVISGCVMLHTYPYERVIAETARVAKHFAVFHRTPTMSGETVYHLKEAYQVPCLEIWFGEGELLGLFAKYGLEVVTAENIYGGIQANGGQRTYLCKVLA